MPLQKSILVFVMKILGLDIGGANTKIAVLDNNKIDEELHYFPIWKRKDELELFIGKIVNRFLPDKIALTMTAEISDAFYNKREGVRFILNAVKRNFRIKNEIYVLTTDAELISLKKIKENYINIASANWTATARYIAENYRTGILIDIGSTTTDIIPIKDGRIIAKGKTDMERLQNNELLYSGVLRTNVATIVNSIPVRKRKTGVSSEYFAITADVYRILNDITEKEYICETPDGRDKGIDECMARLARVICADTEILNKNDIKEIATHLKKMQKMVIGDAIKKISDRTKINNVFICGIGGFLAEEAANDAGMLEIRKIDISTASALVKILKSESTSI